MHATGVFQVPNNTKDPITVYKRALQAADFIYLPKFVKVVNDIDVSRYTVGHNRFATFGKNTDLNAHPFQHEHITLVHNGSLNYVYNLADGASKFDVDSEAIAFAFAKRGYKEVIPLLKGAAALAWHDAKENVLRLYTNGERPLFFGKVQNEDIVLFASEAYMLKWVAARNGLPCDKIYEVGKNKVVTFADKPTPASVEVVPPAPEPVTTNKWPTGWNNFKGGVGQNRYKNKSIKEAMEELGIKEGDIMQFSLCKVVKARAQSRHTTICGIGWKKPYAEVIAYNIKEGEFSGERVLEGRVSTMIRRPELHEEEYAVLLDDIKETAITDETNVAGKVIFPPKKSNILSLPGISQDNARSLNQEDIKCKVRGPNNTWVTKEQFDKLTEHGCAKCTGNIEPIHADFITWTTDKQPLCVECSKVTLDDLISNVEPTTLN